MFSTVLSLQIFKLFLILFLVSFYTKIWTKERTTCQLITNIFQHKISLFNKLMKSQYWIWEPLIERLKGSFEGSCWVLTDAEDYWGLFRGLEADLGGYEGSCGVELYGALHKDWRGFKGSLGVLWVMRGHEWSKVFWRVLKHPKGSWWTSNKISTPLKSHKNSWDPSVNFQPNTIHQDPLHPGLHSNIRNP